MKIGDLVKPRGHSPEIFGVGVIVDIDEEGRFQVLWSEKSHVGLYHHPGYEIKVVA